MKRFRVNKSTSVGFAAVLFALSVGGARESHAQLGDQLADVVPLMTIKIFNDDPNHWIYPVLTTGIHDKPDVWMQAFFKVPKKDVNNDTYLTLNAYRIYINPTGVGIPPGGHVTLKLPLYTRLKTNPMPGQPDQYIDWWNGAIINLYISDSAEPPGQLTRAFRGRGPERQNQMPLPDFPLGAVAPRCPACTTLRFFSDLANLPIEDPSQLLEFTLGARIGLGNVKANQPPNALDLKNVDFDVSYVNRAFGPGAMGPFENDQVGYVGSPQTMDSFAEGISQFLKDYPDWPQFVQRNGRKLRPNPKLPSPLEIFPSLSQPNPPANLTMPPQWPDKLWTPIQALKDNWLKYAGPVTGNGICRPSDPIGTFCRAIADAKVILQKNYNKYVKLFAQGKCNGSPVDLTDVAMLAHVYGWTPFTEAKQGGTGCSPDINLLADTPGYADDFHAEYRRVKLEFDNLNYGKSLTDRKYNFNPWVELIHKRKYLNTRNAYAYSVDDALGNMQAFGTGIIIDFGSAKHLENRHPATPPININLGYDPNAQIRFTRYRICKNDIEHEKEVIPAHPSFIISANDPDQCPIFLFDNKAPPQLYTFTLKKGSPEQWKFFEDPSNATWVTAGGARQLIDCSGNRTEPGARPSSKTWCCDRTAKTGLKVFTNPDFDNPHASRVNNANTIPAQTSTQTSNSACNVR